MAEESDELGVPTDVWRDPAAHIGFFTNSMVDSIPNKPGVYAWFFPLQIDGTSLESLKSAVSDNLNATCFYSSGAEAEGELRLGWESLRIRARRESKLDFDKNKKTWKELMANGPAFRSLMQAMYVSTLFCRPLYVGLTRRTLRQRYEEHAAPNGTQFHERFTGHMRQLGLPYSVSDLLFACVPISVSKYTEVQVDLLEEILKHLCQPPFGKK